MPGHTAINAYIRNVDKPNRKKIGIEKAWTSASLSASLTEESISPDAIHWLIWVQEFYRKFYHSKPLTIREAKWFNRLSGFREGFWYPSDIDFTIFGKDMFASHVIATWAQIYAYREKIDTIAGITEPDYSDLDSAFANGNPSATNDYNDKLLWDARPITGEEPSPLNSVSIESGSRISGLKEILMTKVTKERLKEWKDKYLLPYMIDAIRFIEILILHHSLGDPDMSGNSINSYGSGLLLFENTTFRQRLMKLPYILRIRFLILLREWVKEHPDANDAMIKPKVKIILDKVEKEGEANGKR